MVFDKD